MSWSRRNVLSLTVMGAPLLGLSPFRSAKAALLQPAASLPLPEEMKRRVICIGGTITEILYALGASSSIIGVDSTSNYPPEALKEKANIGYMRQVSPEGVLSLSPSLILVMRDAGPPAALDQIAQSPVPMIYVDATPTAEAVVSRVVFLGRLFNLKTESEILTEKIQQGFNQLALLRAKQKNSLKVMFVLMAAGNQAMIGGKGTAADSIISLAGGENAAADMHGYTMVGAESIMSMAPDFILTMQHAGVPLPRNLLQMPGFANTPAGKRNAAIAMDGELLLGFGPRTPDAALILAHSLQGTDT